jgi:nicotinamidase-related amidase
VADRSDNPHRAALLLIDVINDFDFNGADELLDQMRPAVAAIRALCAEARAQKVPIIYVNDNFGLWHSEKAEIVEYCRRPESKGREIVERLAPEPDDYFVVKPRHSGFFATSLPVLLPDLRARRLIMTGVAADICVLFTANDAYMRDYGLWIPADCVAANTRERSDRALDHMAKILKAETRSAHELPLARWLDKSETSDRFAG